jgi:hypothetical protein
MKQSFIAGHRAPLPHLSAPGQEERNIHANPAASVTSLLTDCIWPVNLQEGLES